MLQWYGGMVKKRPIVTQTVTAVAIMGLGDLLCQYITSKSSSGLEKDIMSLDYKRAFKQASFGIFYTPFQHLQVNIIVPKLFPGKDFFSVIKSVLYNQSTSAPIFNYTFFTYLDILSGKSKEERKREIKKKFLPTLINNWKVMPFVMIIVFMYIQIEYRIMFFSFISLFWNIYLSLIQNKNINLENIQKGKI